MPSKDKDQKPWAQKWRTMAALVERLLLEES